MAVIIKILKSDTKEIIEEKLKQLGNPEKIQKGFDAKKFTGRIKSFIDGLTFQNTLRNEW